MMSETLRIVACAPHDGGELERTIENVDIGEKLFVMGDEWMSWRQSGGRNDRSSP